MAIDLKNAPPNPQELAQKRIVCQETIDRINSKDRVIKKLSYLVFIAAIITGLSLWTFGIINTAILLSAIAGMIMTIAMFATASIEVTLGTVLAGFLFIYTDVIPGFKTYAAITIFLLTSTYITYFFYKKYIESPRKKIAIRMEELIELEHSDKPDECIQFVEWCKIDDVLRNYQHQLAEMGRKPTLGEYQAAKTWVEGAEQRSTQKAKNDKAKAACAKMTVPI